MSQAHDERRRVEEALAAGHVEFCGLELLVAPGALVPRTETELLARTAIDELQRSGATGARIADMCCGAGNLACAIAHHVPGARVWACDLTDACVELARRNASRVDAEGRLSVHQGDLFGALSGLGLEGTLDMVVCNPPYISEKRLTDERRELLELEPQEAFAAGPYGLAIHQRVVRDALPFLRPGGVLLMEIGAGQQRQVEMLLTRARGYEPAEGVRDAAGEVRVVSARRREPGGHSQEKVVD